MWQIIWVSVKHRVARYQGICIESKSLVDLTIKRPDDTSDHDVPPSTLHSRSSSNDSTHQLGETCNENEESLLHISDVIRDINTGEPHNSMEFSLLSEANHTYHLVQSFKSSRFAKVLDERIKKPHSHYPKQQPGNYSSFSMIQFMHELVRKQVILDHTHKLMLILGRKSSHQGHLSIFIEIHLSFLLISHVQLFWVFSWEHFFGK